MSKGFCDHSVCGIVIKDKSFGLIWEAISAQ